MPHAAVIICTRNRPADLARTLRSVAAQEDADSIQLLVVDASDPDPARQNQRSVSRLEKLPSTYCRYRGEPSLTRQRNHGLDLVPTDSDVVFFLDDDVTLHPGYFRRILTLFERRPDLVGVGGYDVGHRSSRSPALRQWLRRVFLLDAPRCGHILLSGKTTSPHRAVASRSKSVEWLTGFSMAYRRSVFGQERFDEALDGYPLYDDCDLSTRVRRHGKLMTVFSARLVHRVSPTNRYDPETFTFTALICRYWFVEKNIRHPLRKPAFWWATLGQLLATATSRKASKWAAFRGLLRGIRAIWRRDHPLLRAYRATPPTTP